jgi:ferredoxin
MIISFSGTGNSLSVARQLSRLLGEELTQLRGDLLTSPDGRSIDCRGSERVVWVFPVYSWGVPPMVADVMRRVTIAAVGDVPHFMVATCGDDTGLTHLQWRRLMAARGWKAVGAYSVTMPNVYTLMKGFDVDSPQVERDKLARAAVRVTAIAPRIADGERVDDLTVGRWAWLKSRVIYPWFIRFAMSPRPFHSTGSCTSCGRCANCCPAGNITLDDGLPRWGDRCALCLRCYHTCHAHAVAYGKATRGKGQYLYHEARDK